MSTRAMYSFIDDGGTFHVYKHHDGYPTKEGAYGHIEGALKYAWRLPRFEADEFGAAFVTACRVAGIEHLKDYPEMIGGGVRLMPSGDWKEVASFDLEYRYEIRARGNVLEVRGFEIKCDWDKEKNKEKWTERVLKVKIIKGKVQKRVDKGVKIS